MTDFSPALTAKTAILQRLPSARIAQKGLLGLGIKLGGAGVALLLQVVLARVLGHSGYGQYAYVVAWVQLMLIFAHGGFATAAMRYVAEYRARHQPELVRGFLRRSSQIVLIGSLALSICMTALGSSLVRAGSVGTVAGFLIAGAILPVFAMFTLSSAVVRGLGHIISSMLVGLVQPLVLLVTLAAAAYVLNYQVSSSAALLLLLVATVMALMAAHVLQRRAERGLDLASQPAFHTAEWLVAALQMMFASSLIYVQGRTGVIISGLLLNAGDAGTYAAMERLTDAALLGLASVNTLIAPTFAAIHAQGRRHDLQRYARWGAWGSTSFMLAAVLPLVLFGRPILRLFGDQFVPGYPVLLVLLVGVAVNAACGSVGLLLQMTNHQRDVLIIAFAGLCLNVLLSLLLIPRYGILGTAIANSAAMVLWNISMLLVVRYRLGVWCCVGRLP